MSEERTTRRAAIFAVEDTAIQVHWGDLAAGEHELVVGEVVRRFDHDGGPGAVVADGLQPDRDHAVTLDGRSLGQTRTLPTPPGELLTRIATVSDLHIGEHEVGLFPRLQDDDEHALHCTTAALDQLKAWGAELLVVKGDLSSGNRDEEYATIAPLLTGTGLPLVVLPGNHDGGNHARDDVVAAMARFGVTVHRDVHVRDVPGARVIAVNTMRDGRSAGAVEGTRREALLEALRTTDGPCLVFFHHQLQPTPFPFYWPPGIVGPKATALAQAITEANPATLLTSGHTHRHRRRQHGSLVITEVGSTKDYPGTWAGYAVHAGGVRQVVRRVTGAAEMTWTERTGRIMFGVWGRWSPGRIDERCFTHLWSGQALGGRPRRVGSVGL